MGKKWKPGPTPEERIAAGSAIMGEREHSFIAAVRAHADVGYGFMQQVIEWEWQNKAPLSWGPEYFEAKIKELEDEVRRLEEHDLGPTTDW